MTRHPHFVCRTAARVLGLAVSLLCIPPFLAAQEPISVTTISASVSSLTINDVDFVHSTTPKWLFTIEVRTQSGGTVRATMTIALRVELANGESFTNPPAVSLETDTFVVNGVRTFTNLDFRDPILRKAYVLDPTAKKRFEDLALPSGALPAGIYAFDVQVTPVPGGTTENSTFTIVLTNPSSLELVFPLDGDPAVSQLPLFQWIFDGPRSTIAVFERLPGQLSLEEAASGIPHVSVDLATTSFQYPGAGVRALEPGKTYVWFVEGHIPTAGGNDRTLKSPLRSFTVAATGVSSLSSLLDELERALDPKYRPLFDQIRTDGLAPSGILRLNGSAISTGDVLRLITQLRNNPESVLSVGLE